MYNTRVKIIYHIYKELLPQIMDTMTLTDEELAILIKAKKIMLKKASEIEKTGEGAG